jgi:hypothetical protein
MARARLARIFEADGLLLFTVHHIIADARSVGVAFRELTELYAALTEGRPAELPELPISYADFATWQRDRLRGGRLEAELERWRTELSGLPPPELPATYPRTGGPPGRAGLYPVMLGAAETAGLRTLARRGGTSRHRAEGRRRRRGAARCDGRTGVVHGGLADRAPVSGGRGDRVRTMSATSRPR